MGKKLVFVSCDHINGLIQNGSALCRATSNASPGIPFKPVKVTAVDMFPHTDCVEVVMLFERDTSCGTVIPTTKQEKGKEEKDTEEKFTVTEAVKKETVKEEVKEEQETVKEKEETVKEELEDEKSF